MKQNPNGDILFDPEEVPESLKGYKRDSKEPRLFHLDYLQCIHRVYKMKRLICGRQIPWEQCAAKGNCLVTRLFCSQCDIRKETE